MDSQTGQSGPYRESGRHAAHSVSHPTMHASFADLMTPDALEQRAVGVTARARRQVLTGAYVVATALVIALLAAVKVARVKGNEIDAQIEANMWLLGVFLAGVAAYFGFSYMLSARRLREVAQHLRTRAQHDRGGTP